MIEPTGVFIQSATGEMSEETGRYTKRLSGFDGVYQDAAAFRQRVQQGDPVVYEVCEYKVAGSDLFFGTTTMMPGAVGGEFYMTRGHYHRQPTMAEIYYTQSGRGVLLLKSRGGETRYVDMTPGLCAFIPPGWAHRTVNTGPDPLVFVWCSNPESGQDYGDIRETGMGQRVFEAGAGYELRPDPAP